jgi:hypothetical protein
MKTHLQWLRVTAAAVLVAGVGVHQAAAQYAPYRPIPQQPAAAPAVAAPQQAQAPAAQKSPYDATVYTAYRTPAPATSYQPTPTPAYPSPTPAYASPTGAQYTQPTAAYPQYPQTGSKYPATYGAYPYVAQQPTPETMPAPKQMNTSAAQPSTSAPMPAPAGGMPVGGSPMAEGAAAPSGCNCTAGGYGAGDYYTTQGCGCQSSGGYPNCGINNYFGDTGCTDNQWFGGVYFLEMGRTNATPVRLTTQVPAGSSYPYYPPSESSMVLTTRDANFDFREGVEARFGSTFTIGDTQSACQSSCGYNTGCGCNSCAPTTYAWEVAWWGLNDSPSTETVVYTTDRLVGMKNFVGLQFDSGGGPAPVNNYYGYGLPVDVIGTNPQILAQRVRTDFKAQNLELNIIRFPVCNTGCGGCDTCGCNTNCTGCNGGCDDGCGCGLGFSMYGSCGVRYFHVEDDFGYDSEFNPSGGIHTYDGFTYDNAYELAYDIEVKNNLVGPQVGWTSDYCWGRWNLFCNSTFGIFDNHMTSWQRMWSGGGPVTFAGDGSTFNVRTNKDAVAFLGELRVGTAYEFSCHWRGVIAYRAVAITGMATAQDQMSNDYSNRWSVGIIDSDNSVIIHGAQVGAECRY